MLAARGKPVTYLKRLSMGPLRLDPELAPGAFRMLTAEEKKLLRTAGRGVYRHNCKKNSRKFVEKIKKYLQIRDSDDIIGVTA